MIEVFSKYIRIHKNVGETAVSLLLRHHPERDFCRDYALITASISVLPI